MTNAMTNKWTVVVEVAHKLSYRDDRIAKWKQRGFIAPKAIVPLIMASEGKLEVADFVEQEQDADQG